MSTLFIYYSHSGNGDIVAEKMREKGADVRKVTPKKSLPKSFFGSILKGGFLATIGYKMPLADFTSDLDGYDRVVIGTPIWNGRVSCPINSVLASLDFTGKSLAFILYAGGGEAPKAVGRLAERYPNAPVLVLKEPKKFPDELLKVETDF